MDLNRLTHTVLDFWLSRLILEFRVIVSLCGYPLSWLSRHRYVIHYADTLAVARTVSCKRETVVILYLICFIFRLQKTVSKANCCHIAIYPHTHRAVAHAPHAYMTITVLHLNSQTRTLNEQQRVANQSQC